MPTWRNLVSGKLILFSLLSILAVSAGTIATARYFLQDFQFKRAIHRVDSNMRVGWRVLNQLGPQARIENGKLMVGSTVLNRNADFVGDIEKLVGGTVTLFQGDRRIASTIAESLEHPVIGTDLAQGGPRDAVLGQHRRFRGLANELGTAYFAGYDPILDASGAVIGVLFVGLPQQAFLAGTTDERDVLLAAAGGMVLLTGLIILIMGWRFQVLLRTRERLLEDSCTALNATVESVASGLAMWGSDGRLVLANKRFAEISDIAPELLQPGYAVRDWIAAMHRNGAFVGRSLPEVLAQNMAMMRTRLNRDFTESIGGGRLAHVSYRPMADGRHMVSFEDVTERKQAERQVAFMARHDVLTGSPNRMLFHERLSKGLQHGQLMALMCLDLDRFKEVNDTFGHPAGDKLLQQVTERLRLCVRDTDTVARLGGDEFAVIHDPLKDEQAARAMAARIVDQIGRPYEIDGYQVNIGTSIGIAVAKSSEMDADTLIRQADLALYRAKDDGRGCFRFFEPGMEDALLARRQLETDMRKALDDKAFSLEFQPIVSLRTGKVSSVEALLRWDHPTLGMVPPDRFIPVAEESGLIVALGAWMIREACTAAAAWRSPARVAVNFSAVQFRDRGLAEVVRDALETSGLPADRLELEITESILVLEAASSNAGLHQLRELGTRICLDDFGTGQSSLSYLRTFPFDKIKIDREFVRDLGTSRYATAIVSAVVDLAQTLGITTVAEGVETDQQRTWLLGEGCREAQGYLFGRPVSNCDVPDVLARLGWADEAECSEARLFQASPPSLIEAALDPRLVT